MHITQVSLQSIPAGTATTCEGKTLGGFPLQPPHERTAPTTPARRRLLSIHPMGAGYAAL